jgi:ATP synthase protein I
VRKRLGHLPRALAVSAVALAIVTIIGYVIDGGTGAAGAAAGVALVMASYTVSAVIVAWTDAKRRDMLLAVGVGTYIIKFSILGVVLYAVSESGWSGVPAMAIGIIVGVVAWTGAQIWYYRTARIPYVEIDE